MSCFLLLFSLQNGIGVFVSQRQRLCKIGRVPAAIRSARRWAAHEEKQGSPCHERGGEGADSRPWLPTKPASVSSGSCSASGRWGI